MIVVTAGHIGHGKTALLQALTGVDADRLPEEKCRGITIDLGYAYQTQDDGSRIGFIDVPGHERLVRTMLAGASGVDTALLVVAADDGPMPQTSEHLTILDLLSVRHVLVALTKIDRVPRSRVAEIEAAVATLLDGTALAGAPIVPCSAMAWPIGPASGGGGATRPHARGSRAFPPRAQPTGREASERFQAADLVEIVVGGTRLGFSAVRLRQVEDEITMVLATRHHDHADSPGASIDELRQAFPQALRDLVPSVLRRLLDVNAVRCHGRFVHLPGHIVRLSIEEESLWQEVRDVLVEAGLDQPRIAFLADRLRLDEATLRPFLDKVGRLGRLRHVSKSYVMLPRTIERLAATAQKVADTSPERLLTVGRFREATGIGRHMTRPLLEFFDAVGFTQRLNEGRHVRRDAAAIFAVDVERGEAGERTIEAGADGSRHHLLAP